MKLLDLFYLFLEREGQLYIFKVLTILKGKPKCLHLHISCGTEKLFPINF